MEEGWRRAGGNGQVGATANGDGKADGATGTRGVGARADADADRGESRLCDRDGHACGVLLRWRGAYGCSDCVVRVCAAIAEWGEPVPAAFVVARIAGATKEGECSVCTA